ncbi:MAG: hypothetical protein RLZZ156_1124 [Deinococcota bacterium]|jgi:hypothetical protein
MPDQTCVHLSPIGNWCRLKNNFKCPAQAGRIGCPFPKIPSLNDRAEDRRERIAKAIALETIEVSAPSIMPNPLEQMRIRYLEREMFERQTAFEKLTELFPLEAIEWRLESRSRDQRRALVRPVLSAKTVTDRLETVVGTANWSDFYTNLPGSRVACRLTILGVTKEAISAALEPELAYNDALVRAAAKFGVGRALERIVGTWVDWDDNCQQPLEPPVLPDWAVATLAPQIVQILPSQQIVQMPSQQAAETRTNEKLITDLIRAVRQLPGGEIELRRLMRRRNRWHTSTDTDKRALYSELRKAYRQLSGGATMQNV